MRPFLLSLLAAVALALAPVSAVAAPSVSAAPRSGIPLPGSPYGDPLGSNDWGCAPTAERPTPVILVHGTFGDRRSLLDPISIAMKRAGFCVYSLDYGNRATDDIRDSAAHLGEFVERVLEVTDAEKVSLVGHSQGGMMPRYYIKNLGGDAYVEDLVGLAPSNHGTAIIPDTGSTDPTGFCVSCAQQAAGSQFLADLNAGDETPGDVSYTQIASAYDEIVVPYTSGFLAEGPNTTNVRIQDVCGLDLAEHGLIVMSQAAIRVTLDALSHEGPATPGLKTC
ncbi:triacylglycerol esterase/lipase EstA (alpha/beta hydrolase family) [Nocardioides luteus]|uniref:Lipase n=1 Tax=Nocardioides luteus TaxID=1844 RepID=A0ABQ5SWQ5_9ACTN|nr:alpha/beta fold hydrolase [Nocardioides luteus]MDR7309499.1 triacylglycerol esterase/lipase EstA (alpha/beta hydrolase family) [Nocardioides luteus]GGR51645.1 lipase [Nocardioides luteus]GLJ67904.1 lipase [Nocardioides luteus]